MPPKEERKTSKAASYGMIPRSESRKLAESNNTKIQLTWKNVTISSLPRGRCGRQIPGANEKVIIDDVSGTVAPGQFLAIIGASGMAADYNHKQELERLRCLTISRERTYRAT